MSERHPDPIERTALWDAYGQCCYWCGEVRPFRDIEVDHIIPQALRDNPSRVTSVLTSLGLHQKFSIDSFENYAPICRRCNGTKTQKVFEATPLIRQRLDKAANLAPALRTTSARWRERPKLAKAVAQLEAALKDPNPDPELLNELPRLKRVLELHDVRIFPRVLQASASHRVAPKPIALLDDDHAIIADGDRVGLMDLEDPSRQMWFCGTCAMVTTWNGAQCTQCGRFDEW